MNEIITNLMNDWGFSMPTNIFMPMVYIISTIAFCLVFWIICKVVSPNASAMRTFVMKYVCVVMAVVVCLSCLSTNGITINVDNAGDPDAPSEPSEPDTPSPTETIDYAVCNFLDWISDDFSNGVDLVWEDNWSESGIICLGFDIVAEDPVVITAYKNGELIADEIIDGGGGSLMFSVNKGDEIIISMGPYAYTEDLAIFYAFYPNVNLIATQ